MGKKKMSEELRRHLAELGSKGGKSRAARLSEAERKRIARKGGKTAGRGRPKKKSAKP
jgi:hypothetical protein